MKGNRAVVTVAVIVLVFAAGWWLLRRGRSGESIELLSRFDAAEKRPSPETFSVTDITIDGDSKTAIAVAPSVATRLKYVVRIPDDGWLSVNLGLKPEAWQLEGDGVLFRVIVSDTRASDTLFTQHVNPFGTPTDRKWIPVFVDLSAYAGEEVELYFNTNASPPNKEGDLRNDLAVWGAPAIVVR
jgi:hypothetical protein